MNGNFIEPLTGVSATIICFYILVTQVNSNPFIGCDFLSEPVSWNAMLATMKVPAFFHIACTILSSKHTNRFFILILDKKHIWYFHFSELLTGVFIRQYPTVPLEHPCFSVYCSSYGGFMIEEKICKLYRYVPVIKHADVPGATSFWQ